MKETEPDRQFEPEESTAELDARAKDIDDMLSSLEGQKIDRESPVVESKPDETQLAIIALLMRLYDVNMALLSHFDAALADEIFDSHAAGGSFNPALFIPQFGDENG